MVPPFRSTMSTATTVRSGVVRLLRRQRAEPSLRLGVCNGYNGYNGRNGSWSVPNHGCGATSQRHVCSPHAHRRRWQSSAGFASTDATPDVPAPTWSVANLRLKADPSDPDDTISEEELYRLAHRCLIDVRTLPQEERDALRRDLAGIMRCVSVVSEASQQISESMEGDDCIGPEELYDAFRGQYRDGAPLRDDRLSNDNDDDESMEDWRGMEEAQQILTNALKSGKKSIGKDADEDTYFSVTTGGGGSSGADK